MTRNASNKPMTPLEKRVALLLFIEGGGTVLEPSEINDPAGQVVHLHDSKPPYDRIGQAERKVWNWLLRPPTPSRQPLVKDGAITKAGKKYLDEHRPDDYSGLFGG